MNDYQKSYAKATQQVLKRADALDRATRTEYYTEYKLRDIAYVLRNLYADHVFRDKFVGNMQFQGFTPWPKGFCALSSICVYELYGGSDVWEPYAIKMGAWEYAPVVFLRHRLTGEAFDATGDQFAPLVVPYHLGTPINRKIKDMRTPNKAEFIKRVKQELDRL